MIFLALPVLLAICDSLSNTNFPVDYACIAKLNN